uniref:Uncharacterized protein n=1 Tax=Opuntia streptacantha TaxID=393608 RepID=A0A7C9CQR2_OPUST
MLLGFQNVINFRFVGFPTILKHRGLILFPIQGRPMGSGKKDALAKPSVSVSSKSQIGPSQESVIGGKLAEILSIKDDPAKLERMTVPELRTALRLIRILLGCS